MKRESQETRIALLENNHDMVMEEMKEIKQLIEKMDGKIDKALEGKANVWVEDALRYGLYTVAGILITSFMYLIIK